MTVTGGPDTFAVSSPYGVAMGVTGWLTVGFTGSRNLSADRADWIDRLLVPNIDCAEYVTGACVGVDECIARSVAKHHPTAVNTIIVPADRSRVSEDFLTDMHDAGANIIYMPVGTTYRDRNQRIVDWSELLIGLPDKPEHDYRSRRSGTWQTIRLAWESNKPTHIYIG